MPIRSAAAATATSEWIESYCARAFAGWQHFDSESRMGRCRGDDHTSNHTVWVSHPCRLEHLNSK